jgi:hypothetical protein
MRKPAARTAPTPHTRSKDHDKEKINALLLTAALSGLAGGTSVAAQTATTGSRPKSTAAKAGLRLASLDKTPPAKHSCKGKNDCKGTGGCKSSDQGCKGKNTCKGKGGCATDGSKPHRQGSPKRGFPSGAAGNRSYLNPPQRPHNPASLSE